MEGMLTRMMPELLTLWIENNTDIVEYGIWLHTTDKAEICAKEIKTVRVFPYIGSMLPIPYPKCQLPTAYGELYLYSHWSFQ